MITKTPDVCGGDARVAGTRIPVWCLVAVLKRAYPRLSIADMHSAFVYAFEHREEIEEAIDANENDG